MLPLHKLVKRFTSAVSFATLCLFVVCSVLGHRIWRDYGPWAWGPSSDSSIPWYMANSTAPWSGDYLYYFGQDRMGGWPFIAMRLWHDVSGFFWSLEAMQGLIIVSILSGGLWFSCLWGRGPIRVVALAVYAVAILFPSSGFALVQSSAYVWQLPTLLGALLCLHRFMEEPNTRDRLFYFFVTAFLAIWSSPLSGGYLLVAWLTLMMLLPTSLSYLRAGAAIVGAGLLERGVHHLHKIFSINEIAVTEFALDPYDDPYERLSTFFTVWWRRTHYPLIESMLPLQGLYFVNLAVTFLLAIGLFLVRKHLLCLWLAPTRERFRLFSFAIYASLAMIGESVVVALSEHFRHNEYDPRYLTSIHIFSILAFFAFVGVGAAMLRPRTRWMVLALPLLTAAFLFYETRDPVVASRPEYLEVKAKGEALEAEGQEGDLLLGAYWVVYRLVTFQTKQPMEVLVVEGSTNRMQWDIARLRQAKRVMACHAGTDAFGLPEDPVPEVVEYGVKLRYTGKKPKAKSLHEFSWYEVVANTIEDSPKI